MVSRQFSFNTAEGRVTLTTARLGRTSTDPEERWAVESMLDSIVYRAQGTSLGPLRRLLEELSGRRMAPKRRAASIIDEPFPESEARQLLRSAYRSGRLQVERIPFPKVAIPLEDAEASVPAEMGPQPEVEETLSDFSVALFDEGGNPIDGIELVFSNAGKTETAKTNGQGIAEFKGHKSSFGQLSFKDPQQVADKVEGVEPAGPDWMKGLLQIPLREKLPGVQLESSVRQNLVITPEPADLLVQLFDKTGQFALKECDYEIEGAEKLSGTTDENGKLHHPGVRKGDYKIKVTIPASEAYDVEESEAEAPLVAQNAQTGVPQIRQIGTVPYCRTGRLRGYMFDTNKYFLLPTAMDSLKAYRQIALTKGPANLILVGHTDTTGAADYNQTLSEKRALAVKQLLEHDIDAWLDYYGSGTPEKERWGGREDRLMILGLCMAEEKLRKAQGEENPKVHWGSGNMTAWYQARHNDQLKLGDKATDGREELEVDGKMGPKTRKELVTDYFALLEDPWTETKDAPLKIATMGLGAECPLDQTGLAIDERAIATSTDSDASGDSSDDSDSASEGEQKKRNPRDRRIELLFFFPEFDVEKQAEDADKEKYLTWREHAVSEEDAFIEGINSKATVVPITDAHFRTGSAVMLPEGEAPTDGQGTATTSVGAVATILRFMEERPGHKLLVAGHTDSVGSDKDNDKLSDQRAELVNAVVTGDQASRDTFAKIANETAKVEDWQQILKWTAAAFPAIEELVDEEEASNADSDSDSGGDDPEDGKLGTGFGAADPGDIDGNKQRTEPFVLAFQNAYNENRIFITGDDNASKLEPDGKIGPKTWGAIFDLYQYNIAQELGESIKGAQNIRKHVQYLDDDTKFVGFGEHHPADGNTADAAESQANRRVEMLLFEENHEPDLAVLKEAPEASEVYSPDAFERAEVKMRTAKRVKVKLKDVRGLPFRGAITVHLSDGESEVVHTTAKGVLSAPVVGSSVALESSTGFVLLGKGKFEPYEHETFDTEVEEIPDPPARPSVESETLAGLAGELDLIDLDEELIVPPEPPNLAI